MELKLQPKFYRILGVIVLYWIVSISLVFINKYILSGGYGDNDLSIFIACCQSMAAVLLINFMKSIGSKTNHKIHFDSFDVSILTHPDMLRLSFYFVASLTLNNLMLKHIEVAFYQVARSFTLIFTVVLSVTMLKKPVTLVGVLACIVIFSGFYLSIDQENTSGTLSIWGIIYGILASLLAALCGIYFKKAEAVTDGNSLKLAYYNNLVSSFIFLILVFSTGQINYVFSSNFSTDVTFWIVLMFSGFLSLSLGWVSALQIKHTSPVTHHISINAKSVTQTVVAVLYFGTTKSFLWWCGNLFVFSGVMLYAYSKTKEKPETTQKVLP